MKKALVLGVLAIFAISIANVNAQDRTNVQQKPKKTYTKESTAKFSDSKAVSAAKPAANTSTSKNIGSAKMNKNAAKTATADVIEKNAAANEDAAKAAQIEAQKKAEQMESESERTNVNANNSKKVGKTPINNSVPPTPKTSTAKSAKAKQVNVR